jgi:hypothetical protein
MTKKRKDKSMSCAGCGCVFSSMVAFDSHRSGKWGVHEAGGWTGWLQRWCVPPGEVKDKDGNIVLRQRDSGVWEHAESADRMRERFGRPSLPAVEAAERPQRASGRVGGAS